MTAFYCFTAYAIAVLVLLPLLAVLYRHRAPRDRTPLERTIDAQLSEGQPE